MLDLRAPGVEIRPIPTIDGHQLNEVFLRNVAVPVDNRVGEEGQAWTLIRDALAVERHLQLLPGRVERDFQELLDHLAASGRACDADVASIAVDVAEVRALALHTLELMERGSDTTVAAACTKLLGTTVSQRIARLGMELGWPELDDEDDPLRFLWSQTVMETIAGGTSEILRGVISRQALGLRPA
jgi:alkylation response protein AidB-like acyl-CoA dehydrogenase